MEFSEYYDYLLKEKQLTIFNNQENSNFTENDMVADFCQLLQKQYKLKIEKWVPNRHYYPDYMFLGGDRGILAYIKFKIAYDINDADSYSLKETIELISRAESELDRPMFLVTFVCCKNNNYFFFETNEEIKDRIFFDSTASKNGKYIVNKNCIGDIAEFIHTLQGLKKNNVIAY